MKRLIKIRYIIAGNMFYRLELVGKQAVYITNVTNSNEVVKRIAIGKGAK